MNEIQKRRNEAMSAYEAYYAHDLVSEELAKFSALQAGMLAEIALQLAGINEKLNTITARGGSADLQNGTLKDIAGHLRDLAELEAGK